MLFSSGTMAFQYYAQMWLLYSLTESVLLLGALGVVRGLSSLLFGLYGGALADRMDRRKLLLATIVVSLSVNAAIGFGAVAGVIQLWQVFALIFIGSATASVGGPIRQALIPELIPPEDIPNAVALTTAARMGAFALAPITAGIVIDAVGPGAAYALSPLGNVISFVALFALRYRGQSTAARREPVGRSIVEGLTYVRRQRVILWIVVATFVSSALGFSLYTSLIVKWAGEVLNMEPGQYGRLATMWGIGTLGASYLLAFLVDIPQRGRIFVFGSIAFAASFAVFGLTRSLPLAGAAYLVNGAAWTSANIASTAIVQSVVHNEVRGRVMSIFMINSAVAQMSGIVLGAIAGVVGMAVLLPGVTILCTAVLVVLWAAVPTLRQLDRRLAVPGAAPPGTAAAGTDSPVASAVPHATQPRDATPE